jgi:hypothetical protein
VLQAIDLFLAAFDRLQALCLTAVSDIVEVEQFLDVGKAEADPLAAQNPGEAGPIAIGVEPLRAAPLGRDQRLILVEAERAGGDRELVAELADRIVSLVLQHVGWITLRFRKGQSRQQSGSPAKSTALAPVPARLRALPASVAPGPQ